MTDEMTTPSAAARARHRIRWAIVLALIIFLGLSSRRFAARLPGFVADYAGDTLYACAVFAGLTIVFPRWNRSKIALTSLAACAAVEISQLYHAPWIDGIRATRLGGWILGFGFLWSDLLCYAAGVGLMIAISSMMPRPSSRDRPNG